MREEVLFRLLPPPLPLLEQLLVGLEFAMAASSYEVGDDDDEMERGKERQDAKVDKRRRKATQTRCPAFAPSPTQFPELAPRH